MWKNSMNICTILVASVLLSSHEAVCAQHKQVQYSAEWNLLRLANQHDQARLKQTIQLQQNNQTSSQQVKFYLYTRLNQDTYHELICNNTDSINSSYINFKYDTTVVVHGYMDSITSDIIQLIKNNLLAREEHNVIGVDWSAIADTIIYSNAVLQVPSVADYLSDFLQFLMMEGQPLSGLHLIGHSLGAHVVGLAGRALNLTHHRVLPRITGLDPAKPGFDTDDATGRLDATDADFVDCIHTCSGELGLGTPVCSADFYPNGETGYQPGCPWWDVAGICSHGRSYEYYAESILLNHKFQSTKCQAVPQNDNSPNCAPSPDLMGDPASPKYKGIFLVKTNDDYPYSQDIVNATSDKQQY